jgi:hypothetical protein
MTTKKKKNDDKETVKSVKKASEWYDVGYMLLTIATVKTIEDALYKNVVIKKVILEDASNNLIAWYGSHFDAAQIKVDKQLTVKGIVKSNEIIGKDKITILKKLF